MQTIIKSTWNPSLHLVKTRLKGRISLSDAERWQQELGELLATVDRPFKLLFDNCGYEFETIAVHKSWREFLPRTLAHHGLLLSLLSPDARETIRDTDDPEKPRCFGMALVHHDQTKMETIDRLSGTDNQRYFSDLKAAIRWLRRLNEEAVLA